MLSIRFKLNLQEMQYFGANHKIPWATIYLNRMQIEIPLYQGC